MIRKATLQDTSRIAEIIVFAKRVAYRPIFNNDFVSFNELQVIDIIEEYRNNPSLIDNVIVYDDGILKGILNRKFEDNNVELCELYVEPFFKGNGIGRELMQYLIQEAKMANKQRIFLWVIKDNLPARRFYEAKGFQANGETCLIEGTSKVDMRYELMLQ